MPQDERPREKLLAHGPDALSNAELIAILLRTGRRGMNVIDVARELLDRHKSFAELSRCSVKELSEIKGIGQAKALELVAAFNLGKRFAQEPISQQKLDSPELIHKLLGDEMRMLQTESLRVVLLDTRYRLKRIETISLGSLNESIAHPREIFRPALTYSAHAVKLLNFYKSNCSTTSSSARHQKEIPATSVSKRQECCDLREDSSHGDCRFCHKTWRRCGDRTVLDYWAGRDDR